MSFSIRRCTRSQEMSQLVQPRRHLFLRISAAKLGSGSSETRPPVVPGTAYESLERPQALHEAFLDISHAFRDAKGIQSPKTSKCLESKVTGKL